MGKYDNFNNTKNILKAQKKLDKLKGKRNPDLFAIDRAQKDLDSEKLFESCQVFGGNFSIKFSDDNQVMWFVDKLVRYEDIKSYTFVENRTTQAHTTTKKKGTISRALVGGVIGGGLGALVGAASAGSKSNTTYYEVANGFHLQVFLTDGSHCQCFVEKGGVISNKIPKSWMELGHKLDTIIEEHSK